MRWLKILGWIAASLLALIAAAGAALWIGGGPLVAWALAHPVSGLIGRQIHIEGPLAVHWGRPTRILAENVHLANAPWGSQPEMFSAKRFEIEIFPGSLLRGPLRAPLLEVDDAKLLLETSAQGEGNWQFGPFAAARNTLSKPPDLRHVAIRRADVLWRDGQTGSQVPLAVSGLTLDTPDPVHPSTIAAEGAFRDLPFRLSGSLDPLAMLRQPARPYRVKLDGALDRLSLAVDGTIGEPKSFAGVDLRLSFDGRQLHDFAARLAIPLPELPEIRGTGVLKGGTGHWALTALTVAMGNSDLEGGITIDTSGEIPEVKANLTSSSIDFADFREIAGGKPASAATPRLPAEETARLIPASHLPLQELPRLNADIAFDVARIRSVGGLPLERISFGLQLRDRAITVKPLRFRVARGDIDFTAHLVPTGANHLLRLTAEVDVRHVDLHELVQSNKSAALRKSGGIVGGFIKVNSTGTAMRDLFAHMSGDAGFFMENGQLSELLQDLAPLDALAAIGVYVSGDKPLPINCLVSRFAIRDGVATASTLLFDTELTLVTGAGNVNFGDETLYLTLKPYNKSPTLVSLHAPVDIGGTFAKPAFHVHTGEIVARLGAAVGLGVLFPPAALLALADTGLGEHNACSKAYAAQQPPGNPTPKSGSSTSK